MLRTFPNGIFQTCVTFPVTELASAIDRKPLSIHIALETTDPYIGDDAIRDTVAEAANAAWERAEAKGSTIFNRPPDAPGLLRTRFLRLDGQKVCVGAQPTWFWTHLGTNAQLRWGTWEKHPELVEAELRDFRDIPASRLANCLSVNLTMISADNPPKVLVQRRGATTGIAQVPYQCSAAGFVDYRDCEAGADAVASSAAAREAFEETGLNVQPSTIAWLGVARDDWSGVVGLVGMHRLGVVSGELDPHPTKDEFEVDGFEWWDFDPDSLMAKWKQLGSWYGVVPLGGYSMLASLALDYGEAAVEQSYLRRF